MIQINYYREKADVVDTRFFKNEEELKDWLRREEELEIVRIISKDEVGSE